MKKFIAMLLALVMVLSLAACGAQAPAETPNVSWPKKQTICSWPDGVSVPHSKPMHPAVFP